MIQTGLYQYERALQRMPTSWHNVYKLISRNLQSMFLPVYCKTSSRKLKASAIRAKATVSKYSLLYKLNVKAQNLINLY